MQQREKILALVAGLMVLYLAGQWMFDFDPFASLNSELDSLKTTAKKEEDKALLAVHAARNVAQWERQALSSNVARSRSDYHYWLLGLIERAKLDDAQVQPERKVTVNRTTDDRRAVLAFEKLPFTIHGQGSLEQLTKMLHEFYSADVLHRVRSLTMQPTKSTKNLKLTLVVEALVMPGSVDYDTQIQPLLKKHCYQCHGSNEAERKAGLRLDSLADAFKPLPGSGKTPIVRERSSSSELVQRISGVNECIPKKRDERLTQNEIDLIVRWINQGAPQGMPAEMPKSKRLALASVNDYLKLIKERDLFSEYVPPRPPPRKVVTKPPPKRDPRPTPPPPPRFDDSEHAYVTAIVEIDDRPEIWLYVRTTGKLHKLHEGDEIQVGRFEGKVKRIGRRSVEIRGERKVSLIGLGENLRADDGE